MQTQSNTETVNENARRANAADLWDKLWTEEGEESWRAEAMKRTYDRALKLIQQEANGTPASVVDLGGGRGFFAQRVKDAGHEPIIVDISPAARTAAITKGLRAIQADINEWTRADFAAMFADNDWIVATEFIEHLPETTREVLLTEAAWAVKAGAKCLFSVPNNRLGPDEEPQHTIKWTAVEFKNYLAQFFDHVRVEVQGPYMMGVCGVDKGFTMSVCLPARDEEHDMAATLATYRGVADQLVVGVDPRTTDRTREVAAEYADVVFDLVDPEGREDYPDAGVPDGGVHFAHIRNQCIRRCTGDWIFMTEAHERLWQGEDTLLRFAQCVPERAAVGFVLRHGRAGGHLERWGFPWIFRNRPDDIYFTRATHNVLSYADGTYCVRLPEVWTLHERHQDATDARSDQRALQNRRTLMDDWRVNENATSLYYLAQEWRGLDDERAIERFEEFLAMGKGAGEAHYQARLMLAKLYWAQGNPDLAREKLMGCVANNWNRTEHWIWLGDIAFHTKQFEEALQFYRYAETTIGFPPFTLWWIDMEFYSTIPAARLAQVYGQLGRGYDALHWARRYLELIPPDAPDAVFEEARGNIQIIEQALNITSGGQDK